MPYNFVVIVVLGCFGTPLFCHGSLPLHCPCSFCDLLKPTAAVLFLKTIRAYWSKRRVVTSRTNYCSIWEFHMVSPQTVFAFSFLFVGMFYFPLEIKGDIIDINRLLLQSWHGWSSETGICIGPMRRHSVAELGERLVICWSPSPSGVA